MRILICFFIILLNFSSTAQKLPIIPRPALVGYPAGVNGFTISPSTLLVLEEKNLKNSTDFFNDYLERFYSFRLKIVDKSSSRNTIRLHFERMSNPIPGAYRLFIKEDGITIAGDNEQGTFYGIQSLIQLLPIPEPGKKATTNLMIPAMTIEDAPRFEYRGLHLDVSRHFMPVDFVKKYIDFIAMHKMNYFHWHLTEDQGWRIEIKQYPKLTQVGAWRNGTIIGRYPGTGNDGIKYGGFYTQAQIKEVVAYAQKRYVTIIPEIEMPGHSSAAIAAYPELSCFPEKPTEYPAWCAWNGPKNGKQVQQTWGVFDDVYCAGKENTFTFLERVMDEVLALFPSPYIHVGGDECPKVHWKVCPACQQRMKENKLKDEHELQSYFIQRMGKYLESKGRTLIGWDEILEGGLAPNAIVMSWRGEKGGIDAAKEKHKVIMTPGNPVYFDHSQTENEDSVVFGGYNPIEKVYAYEPVPKELKDKEEKYVLGAQANVWTEYMMNTKKVEYMLFPRLSALSEVLWSRPDLKDWPDFERRLLTQFKRYELWKANYSKAYYDLKTAVTPSPDFKGLIWTLSSKTDNKISYRSDGPESRSVYYTEPIKITGNKSGSVTFTVTQEKVKGFQLKQKFEFNKATGKKISLKTDPSKTYPGDGAFTLVNGIINDKGFVRSKEFLGFSGTDCEAVIDLGELTSVSFVVVNFLDRKTSWIYRPQTAEVLGSGDGKEWYPLKLTDDMIKSKDGLDKAMMTMSFRATYARYLKIIVTNWGDIPEGNPGAGKKAWLFIDEIEVN